LSWFQLDNFRSKWRRVPPDQPENAPAYPQSIVLSGPYLSDPQWIAVGYALEQALDGRVEPDLNATIAQIDAVTAQ
jgi:hypothetical protein